MKHFPGMLTVRRCGNYPTLQFDAAKGVLMVATTEGGHGAVPRRDAAIQAGPDIK